MSVLQEPSHQRKNPPAPAALLADRSPVSVAADRQEPARSPEGHRPLKVVFVSSLAYPVFDPSQPGRFGGAEVRATLFARGLAQMGGYDVYFVVSTEGPAHRRRIDGLTLVADPQYSAMPNLCAVPGFLGRVSRQVLENAERTGRFPFVRIHRWRWRLIWQLPIAGVYHLLYLYRIRRLRRPVWVEPKERRFAFFSRARWLVWPDWRSWPGRLFEATRCDASEGGAVFRWFSRVSQQVLDDVERVDGFPWLRIRRWRIGLLWQVPAAALFHLYFTCFIDRRADRSSRDRRSTAGRARGDSVYAKLQPDVVCGFGVNLATAEMVAHCRNENKKSVVFVASDHNLSELYFKRSRHVGPYGEPGSMCYYTLTHADHIVVQSDHQRRLLEERFGRQAAVIRNPIDLSSAPSPAKPPVDDDRYVLWIGRADTVQKRPDLCFELARRCAAIPFVMVMNCFNRPLFDRIVAERPGNVRVVERVPYDQVEAYFRGAVALVNTSVFEGFPNTFLQAGKFGVPVLSLNVDPDGFFERFRCGFCAHGDTAALAATLQKAWDDPSSLAAASEAIRGFVSSRHELGGRIGELNKVLSSLR